MSLDRKFEQNCNCRLQLVLRNSTKHTFVFDIITHTSLPPLLTGRIMRRSRKEYQIMLQKPVSPDNLEHINSSDRGFYASIYVPASSKPNSFKISMSGHHAIISVRNIHAARIAYSHESVDKVKTWYTWSRHCYHWFCFAGSLLDVKGRQPIMRIRNHWRLTTLFDIDIGPRLLRNRKRMLELLVVAIGIIAKDTFVNVMAPETFCIGVRCPRVTEG